MADTPSGAARPALTPSQLSDKIKLVLLDGFPRTVRVVGEVSNLSDRQHWFFSLKDETAVVSCVCFASDASKSGVAMRDGMQVLAHGRVDYYPQQGRLQLYVNKLEEVGAGDLERRLRELIEALRAEGYLDEAAKQPLPAVPRRVAIVTSETGAALQDFVRTARSRMPGIELLLYDVRVQGELAAPQITEALRRLSVRGAAMGIEAVALIRGGGSIEDLWAFNERVVAEAVFDCALPVVVGVGHETDVTVAELVADRRASTPTQAAMVLVPERSELLQQVMHVEQRLGGALRRLMREQRERYARATRLPLPQRIERRLENERRELDDRSVRLQRALTRRAESHRMRLTLAAGRLARATRGSLQTHRSMVDALSDRLRRAGLRSLMLQRDAVYRLAQRLQAGVRALSRRERERLASRARQLQAVSPQRVLERGFSVSLNEAGRAMTDAADVPVGMTMTTLLARGTLVSTVSDGSGEPFADGVQRQKVNAARTAGKPRRRKRPPGGPGLFGESE